jgi:hypothetical protein
MDGSGASTKRDTSCRRRLSSVITAEHTTRSCQPRRPVCRSGFLSLRDFPCDILKLPQHVHFPRYAR